MNRDAAGTKGDASIGALSRALPGCVRHAAMRCASALLVLGTGAFALAADSDNLYQAYTDEELSRIASDWQSLTTEERRDYFIEIRRRMAEAVKRREDPPRIVGERRFGRIIPQPDGSVLRIEGVVRYREGDATGDATGNETRDATGEATPPGYGTGFEQRVEQTAEQRQPASVTAPVVNVNGVGQTEIVKREDSPETATGELEQSAQGRE
jgi:hypothetical protein